MLVGARVGESSLLWQWCCVTRFGSVGRLCLGSCLGWVPSRFGRLELEVEPWVLAVCGVCCDAVLFAGRSSVVWLEGCSQGLSSGPGVG